MTYADDYAAAARAAADATEDSRYLLRLAAWLKLHPAEVVEVVARRVSQTDLIDQYVREGGHVHHDRERADLNRAFVAWIVDHSLDYAATLAGELSGPQLIKLYHGGTVPPWWMRGRKL